MQRIASFNHTFYSSIASKLAICMGIIMKAVYLKQPGNVCIKELKDIEWDSNKAFIRVKTAGICGSDIAAFKGTNPLVSYPRVIGHEIAGEIVHIPDGNHNLKVGDHVIVDPYLY